MPEVPDPTPQQIRRRCEAIQRTWSAAERDRRAVHYAETGPHRNRAAAPGYQREAYTVPTVRMADLDALAG